MRYGKHCDEKVLVPMEDGENIMELIKDATTTLEKVNEPKIQLQNYLRSQLEKSTMNSF